MTNRILIYASGLLITWVLTRFLRSVRTRQILWLLASYLFYSSWGAWFAPILLASSLLNYALGHYLKKRLTSGRLWFGVLLNVALLSSFKYLPSWLGRAAPHSAIADLWSHLALPVGMSFWTFQGLSYLLDIYREEELDPSLLEFCLYMAFWPTVLSGPICRLPDMLPQFRRNANSAWGDVAMGLKRISLGVMWVGLAQLMGAGLRSGEGLNAAFDQTRASWGGGDVWILAVGYGFLLFFDFGGYSHLAIGMARLLGIQVQENFDRPYLSTTPSVFWTRWHMSLSFWIRDYVFLALATRRRETWWRNLSLALSMVIFGLWHQASLLFILWGLYHGLLLVFHRAWQQAQRKWRLGLPTSLNAPVSWAVTFFAVCLGWILFRAHDARQAFGMLGAVFTPEGYWHFALPGKLYLLVGAVVLGYFAVRGVTFLLDRWAVAAEPAIQPPRGRAGWRLWVPLLNFLATDRWLWVAPLGVTLCLYEFGILLLERTAASRFLYMLF
jgi:alginate O-acetyltransferase complex protein AlgI